ncbi:MAG TPA: LysR substrate-binding domain-containing protein, partial [Mycobacterium sp.]|nr:LysR substrate-binding domain-containing protein [Mycobacterium sp.]
MIDPIKDGFDVVFGSGPLQDSTLIARKVFSLALFLCASPDFVGQLAEPLVDPKQLETCPSSTSASAGHTSSRWPNTKGRYELSPQVRGRANNFQVCKQYILQG